ncbi:MAG: Maf family protein [Planctomycetota bacterium]
MPPDQPVEPGPPLVLASRSPRRRCLLEQAGLGERLTVIDPPYDDPATPQPEADDDAASFTKFTALRKAHSVQALRTVRNAVILGADTVCVDVNGKWLGTPENVEALRSMLQSFVNASHNVVTAVGLLLVDAHGEVTEQTAWSDAATVSWGPVADVELQAYAQTNAWRGKAGGYNLDDRLAAGWPIRVQGDPTTVTGLPMDQLVSVLAARGIVKADAEASP